MLLQVKPILTPGFLLRQQQWQNCPVIGLLVEGKIGNRLVGSKGESSVTPPSPGTWVSPKSYWPFREAVDPVLFPQSSWFGGHKSLLERQWSMFCGAARMSVCKMRRVQYTRKSHKSTLNLHCCWWITLAKWDRPATETLVLLELPVSKERSAFLPWLSSQMSSKGGWINFPSGLISELSFFSSVERGPSILIHDWTV